MEQNNLERIENYIFKKMSEEEANLFEQEMNANPALQQEMELHKAIILGIRKKSKNKTLEKIKSFKATLDENEEDALIDDYIFGNLPLEKVNVVDKRIAEDSDFGQKVKLQKAIILGLKKKRKEKTLGKIEMFKKKLDKKESQITVEEETSPSERREKVVPINRNEELSGIPSTDTTSSSQPSSSLFTRLRRPLAIAASIAISIVSIIFFRNNRDSSKDLFPIYAINEQISTTNENELFGMLERINGAAFNKDTDETINELTERVIDAYNKDDFNKAIELANNQKDNRIQYIKALSLWENKNYADSKLTFQNILTSIGDNNFIAVSSNWYLALIALKDNRVDAAKILLNKVVYLSSDFGKDLESYQNNAKQILNEL